MQLHNLNLAFCPNFFAIQEAKNIEKLNGEILAVINSAVNGSDSESESEFDDSVYDHTFETKQVEKPCRDMNVQEITDAFLTQQK